MPIPRPITAISANTNPIGVMLLVIASCPAPLSPSSWRAMQHARPDHGPHPWRLSDRAVQLAFRLLRQSAVRHHRGHRVADFPAQGAAAVGHEVRLARPFLPPGLFKDRNFVCGVIMVFFTDTLLLASSHLMAPYQENLAGYPVEAAGMATAPRGVGTIIGMQLTIRLSAGIDHRLLMAMGLLILGAAFNSMSFWTPDVSQSEMIVTLMIQRSACWFGPDDLRSFGHQSRAMQMGYAPEEWAGNPIIAILNTWSDLQPCHSHFKTRVEDVKRSILMADGFPVELPGLLLGATSMNLPTIFLSAGPMLRGNFQGKFVGSGSDAGKYWDELRAGKITKEDWLGVQAGIARRHGPALPETFRPRHGIR
jgi:hypothetical protein